MKILNKAYLVGILLTVLLGLPDRGVGQTFTFIHDSILRSYIVHLPTNYNPANQYPLVVNMHGLSNTAAIQETYTQMNAVSDTANFIIVYPDATSTSSFNAGFNSPYNSGVDDVGFIDALLDTAIANYSIDTLKIYACGMSNGGFMSYRLACEMEDRFAAIASVTGSMPDSMEYYCQNSRPIPVMQVHGTTDPTVNYNGAPGILAIESTVDYWVQKNNCPIVPVQTALPDISVLDFSTVEKFYYGLCDGATEVVLYKITNGGHTWPGAISVPALGNTNQDFNASGEIWNFFRRHCLPSQSSSTYNIVDAPVTICIGDSVPIYGEFESTSGTYYDSLTSVGGGDSVHSTILTIGPTYTIIDAPLSINTGDSVSIYGSFYQTAGTYYDSLTSVEGCDSVHSTVLGVNPTAISELNHTLNLKIWPNPTLGIVTISGSNLNNPRFTITSLLGQGVEISSIRKRGPDQFELDISPLKNGVYLIKITVSDGVHSEILMKQ